jgi:hypothetical protein
MRIASFAANSDLLLANDSAVASFIFDFADNYCTFVSSISNCLRKVVLFNHISVEGCEHALRSHEIRPRHAPTIHLLFEVFPAAAGLEFQEQE